MQLLQSAPVWLPSAPCLPRAPKNHLPPCHRPPCRLLTGRSGPGPRSRPPAAGCRSGPPTTPPGSSTTPRPVRRSASRPAGTGSPRRSARRRTRCSPATAAPYSPGSIRLTRWTANNGDWVTTGVLPPAYAADRAVRGQHGQRLLSARAAVPEQQAPDPGGDPRQGCSRHLLRRLRRRTPSTWARPGRALDRDVEDADRDRVQRDRRDRPRADDRALRHPAAGRRRGARPAAGR